MGWRQKLLLQQPLKAIKLYIYNSNYQKTLCCSRESCLEAELLPSEGYQRGVQLDSCLLSVKLMSKMLKLRCKSG